MLSRRTAFAACVTIAVAAASADSSVVALALPQLYRDFSTSVVGVSWVLTAYNLAVAVAALAVLPFRRRFSSRVLYGTGIVIFLVASAACAAANGLTFLISARVVQGVGGAVLLAGSIGVLEALTGSRTQTIKTWAGAAGIGVAVGPALGGVLTEVFDWRAIFIVQVPIAALGLGALLVPGRAEAPRDDDGPAHLLPDVSIGLLFGALVGALFLSVLLLIPGWSYSPIRGAAVVSALPLCSLVSRRLIRPPSDDVSVVAGERARRTRARGARPVAARRLRFCRCSRSPSAGPASGWPCRSSPSARSRAGRCSETRSSPSARATSASSRRWRSSRRCSPTRCPPRRTARSVRRPRSCSTLRSG